MNGHFITFEGGDGSGKSTLIDSIYEKLLSRGVPLLKTRAPGAGPTGTKIREILLHSKHKLSSRSELFLFLADRAEHTETLIKPALDKGKTVLCDRFNDSTIAYQGGARDFGLEAVKDLCHFATNGLEPDLTFYLDLDPEIGLLRVKKTGEEKDRIEAENLAFHQKIRDTFHILAKNEPKRFHILDASKSKEAVCDDAMKVIDAQHFAAK